LMGTVADRNSLYRVYVIKNPEGKLYIGLSEDMVARLSEHNAGVSKWTRHRGPWIFAWQSELMNLSEARKLENRLKRQEGGRGFYRLTKLPDPSARHPTRCPS